ncbi:PREDICTED: trypsin-2-like [Nicrophorus vespilloides]|uniref:Trypsin-2-like n=1 Tax=Nicrophorus vespilloides TaxID=110193 RepID=A0ABM1MH48_NICVS|nr:PREDICTED: trypsin-2-like [Nicrophorus vespilloides]
MNIAIVVLFVAVVGTANALFPPKLDGRIVGGESVDIEDFPHQLSLQYYGSHICGASIISGKFALTAAHCTDGNPANVLSVRAGSSFQGSGGQVVKVLKIHQHPKYNKNTVDFDISVLELQSEIKMGAGASAIPLPEAGEKSKEGDDAVVSGWGALSEGGSSPSLLQAVHLKMIGHDSCQHDYNQSPSRPEISDRMICAGVGGGKDACQGDSGGPLISNGKQVGVVSWGFGCARPEYPGIYSSVENLRAFIKEKSGV